MNPELNVSCVFPALGLLAYMVIIVTKQTQAGIDSIFERRTQILPKRPGESEHLLFVLLVKLVLLQLISPHSEDKPCDETQGDPDSPEGDDELDILLLCDAIGTPEGRPFRLVIGSNTQTVCFALETRVERSWREIAALELALGKDPFTAAVTQRLVEAALTSLRGQPNGSFHPLVIFDRFTDAWLALCNNHSDYQSC
jgi:hypothetical protein